MQEQLPHRTYYAIRGRARHLELVKLRPRHAWKARETTLLRRLYPSATRQELLRALPGLDISRIVAAAKNLGLRRKFDSYRPTGLPILDAIRERAKKLGYTMPQLDDVAGTHTYFRKGMWPHQNHRALLLAIYAMGGEISIDTLLPERMP